MTDAGNSGENLPEGGNRQQLDKLIFDQNLDEVHLLVDFISGRADRSIATLSIPGTDASSPPMNSRQIIEKLAEMRYPPNRDDPVNWANAAILLLAKDRLSALAAPARGLTIAYTAMFIDAEVRTLWSRMFDCFRSYFVGKGKTINNPPQTSDNRVDLAVRTFPILQPHAQRFRHWRDRLAWFTMFWLLLTALAYWDAGLGRAVLERLDQNWKTRSELHRDNPDLALLPCETETTPERAAKLVDEKTYHDSTNRLATACQRLARLSKLRKTEQEELRRVFGCAGMSYSIPIHVWCWHWIIPGSAARPIGKPTDSDAMTSEATAPTGAATEGRPPMNIEWQMATSLLSVFTTYMLPMMFALLGTLIGAFRAILNRIAISELAPRDFVRMMLGIPTGLVAGVAVGLFLSPSSVPIEGAGGVGGQLSLTASGLGFLAGYASQSFFTYLDNVVGTVFPNTAPGNTPPPRPAELART